MVIRFLCYGDLSTIGSEKMFFGYCFPCVTPYVGFLSNFSGNIVDNPENRATLP